MIRDNCRVLLSVEHEIMPQSNPSSPTLRPASAASASKPKRRVRVLGFDGAKVHDFLFHVALAEVRWLDLIGNSPGQISSLVENHRARNRASMLYQKFLQACSQGPSQATTFLAVQHKQQKMYLQKAQALLHASSVQNARNQALLSEVVFGAQAVKSAATLGVAIVGLLLTGPELLAGAGITLVFDFSMELVNNLGGPKADAVVVGFKQTTANDLVSVAGSAQETGLESAKQIMEKTLTYPMKSSVYRATAKTASQVHGLMTTLGIISAGVTLYTEGSATLVSYEQMRDSQNYYSSLRDQPK